MAFKNINRSDLIQQLSENNKVDLKTAETIVKSILRSMTHALADRQRVEIRGFGSFELRYREPRKARNPKTGKEVTTSGKYSVHFKPGKEMRDRVNA